MGNRCCCPFLCRMRSIIHCVEPLHIFQSLQMIQLFHNGNFSGIFNFQNMYIAPIGGGGGGGEILVLCC